jgi:hypothetical protein
VLEASAGGILERLSDDDLVLDVGAWVKPFPRADWVLDLLPYETRGLYGYDREARAPEERFSAETWVQRDICDREPWPFADGRFDFAICAQTLEDVRDPVWVVSELARVARAGYVETPSRAAEQSLRVEGPWAGWSHHRWLVEATGSSLRLTFKPAVLHARPEAQLTPEEHAHLSEEDRVLAVWWEGALAASEQIFTSAEELDPWLADVPRPARSRRLLGRR